MCCSDESLFHKKSLNMGTFFCQDVPLNWMRVSRLERYALALNLVWVASEWIRHSYKAIKISNIFRHCLVSLKVETRVPNIIQVTNVANDGHQSRATLSFYKRWIKVIVWLLFNDLCSSYLHNSILGTLNNILLNDA